MTMIKNNERLPEEILMEERIKSGEEIEVTEAIEILNMLKSNTSVEEISKKTNKKISKIEELKKIFDL